MKVEGFKASEVFELMANALEAQGKDLIKKVNGVFLFKVAGEGGKTATWVVDAKNGNGSVRVGKDGTQLCTSFCLVKENGNMKPFRLQVIREMSPFR